MRCDKKMKKCKMLMASILLLTAAFSIVPSAAASEKSIGLANDSQNKAYNTTEMISFVESAVAYAHENGKDKALDEFSNRSGSFVQGDLYIYAYDFNGTNIAHPFKPDWIGKDKINQTDSNGVPYIRNLIEVAKSGKGFTYFIFPNPAHNSKDEFKIGYAMKVDETWWLGSGIYVSCP